MSNDIYTEDLGQFGSRELKEASKLILAIGDLVFINKAVISGKPNSSIFLVFLSPFKCL